MAYETGSATGIADLLNKLNTFATGLTNAWISNQNDGAITSLTRGNCTVTFALDTAGDDMQIFQSLGWLTSVWPSNYTDDSGSGGTFLDDTNGRRVNFLSAGPYTTYHFFAGDGTPTDYIHVVVEIEPNKFRHFGFGTVEKYNDWTGGEYVYGGYWIQDASVDSPTSANHQVGFDINAGSTKCATIHLEGLPNQVAASKWGRFTGKTITTVTNDRGGNPRLNLFGPARSGVWGRHLNWMRLSQLNSYKPLAPIEVIYVDRTETTPAVTFLGKQPHIAIVNMGSLAVGDTLNLGAGEDWMVFPWSVKKYTLDNTEESWNAGFAYRKIV